MRRSRTTSLAALGIAGLMLTGCGSGAAPTASPAPSASVAPAPVRQITPDLRACTGVQAVIGHLAADTAQWSPKRDPFGPPISARIRLLAGELGKQGTLASSARVRAAISTNSRAFVGVADAMTTKKRPKVDQAIAATRVAYKQLKGLCSLS